MTSNDSSIYYCTDPIKIIREALEKNEMDRLLLGDEKYRHLGKYTCDPGITDISALMGCYYNIFMKEIEPKKLRDILADAIFSVVNEYEGLFPVAICLLKELYRKQRGIAILDLPIPEITEALRQSIAKYRMRLICDDSMYGRGYDDRSLGQMRHFSKLAVEYGGESYCESADEPATITQNL